MREKRWLLLALYGILLANAVSGALKATRPKFKIATTSTTTTRTSTTDETQAEENENEDAEATTGAAETNGTNGHTLTGIPQIDYIWDPNLPRELNGYNLSDYPFYNSIPEDIDFKCDGLHDGFYASVPHKCQVYHHCLYGTRYDFLCANFTAFDQKTFICHFVSEVDCANSKKYWHRNDALYKAATTSTTSTSTTTTTTTPAPVTAASGRLGPRDRDPLRRRRPMRRRPAYDYYDEEYYDDDYSRPRGYDRRDDYEYEDRKYRRDRDRDFRDRERDFHDRDGPSRSRDVTGRDERERETSVRERFPSRNNRRDPVRTRDPPEHDVGGRARDQEQGSKSREMDETELEDRRTESRVRDPDDRRYSDKRFKDDYEDKEAAAAVATGNTDGLVKPAAPSSSVYARPRAPPKIRRPVPLSEQDKYAYKATSAQSTEEPRRRPSVDVAEVDYYEDEFEDVRPVRRPLRRRPTFRDRDRDFYEARDRDRDRPFRTRYRDEDDDIRPRKNPDRSRDRYYDRNRERMVERGRDRALDRGKERTPERTPDRDRGRSQESEKTYLSRPIDRERETERSRGTARSKDPQEIGEAPRRGSIYDRPAERTTSTTTTTPTTSTTSTTTTTCLPEDIIRKIESEFKEVQTERTERPSSSYQDRPSRPIQIQNHSTNGRLPIEEPPRRPPQHSDYQEREEERNEENNRQAISSEEYSSEYYDEPEDPPTPPPRTAVRIVKRPFLPSRGGNPNPRGLQPVGSKAPGSTRREEGKATEKTIYHEDHKGYYVQEVPDEGPIVHPTAKVKPEEIKQSYDAYKVIQPEVHQKQREDYDGSLSRPIGRRPVERTREDESLKSSGQPIASTVRGSTNQRQSETEHTLEGEPPLTKWTAEDYTGDKLNNDGAVTTVDTPLLRPKSRVSGETTSLYSSSYKSEDVDEQPSGPGSLRVKQRINEVTHRLQDIPESEYDVTLNDALTPTSNQESNLPSGFVLPLHRQLSRDAVLQSSENNYKVSRPIVQQTHQHQHLQQQQQQKPFVPSPQFLPNAGNERARTIYYRTPETVQISGAQYRQQRGPWHDYTGY